jgi:hypothetical protein
MYVSSYYHRATHSKENSWKKVRGKKRPITRGVKADFRLVPGY